MVTWRCPGGHRGWRVPKIMAEGHNRGSPPRGTFRPDLRGALLYPAIGGGAEFILAFLLPTYHSRVLGPYTCHAFLGGAAATTTNVACEIFSPKCGVRKIFSLPILGPDPLVWGPALGRGDPCPLGAWGRWVPNFQGRMSEGLLPVSPYRPLQGRPIGPTEGPTPQGVIGYTHIGSSQHRVMG